MARQRIDSAGRRGIARDRRLILLLAFALDLALGESPEALHPVVWLGTLIDWLERSAPSDLRRPSLAYGAAATVGSVGLSATAAFGLERLFDRLPRPLRLALVALLLKQSFAMRDLIHAGSEVRHALESNDLDGARHALRGLVSRATAELSGEDCAAAAIESLAENLTDSIVGPWLAYMLLGLPGAWAFRALNTFDSRWGYHGRYEWLGRSAAVLDDFTAGLPARLSAILLIASAALAGWSPASAVRVLLRDRHRTASPNAGWTMAAVAGALGRRLAKRGHYVLNEGSSACLPGDITRAQRLVVLSAILAALLLAAMRLLMERSNE